MPTAATIRSDVPTHDFDIYAEPAIKVDVHEAFLKFQFRLSSPSISYYNLIITRQSLSVGESSVNRENHGLTTSNC